MIVIVNQGDPGRQPVQIIVDDREPGYDPVALARKLREMIPRAARVRWFHPGASEDSADGRSPADILADVVSRLPPKRKPAVVDVHTDDDVDVP